MARALDSFKIHFGNKILDYRLGEELDLGAIKGFFQKEYHIKKLWNGNRHILGILTKNGTTYFLKLSTSEGISIVTKNEYAWNEYFNHYLPENLPYSAPRNYKSGLYQKQYFYSVTEYLDGEVLCEIGDTYRKSDKLKNYIAQIINLSEVIQDLPAIKFTNYKKEDYRVRFINKVNKWFNDIPVNVRKKFKLEILLSTAESGVDKLISKPRHGDFAPWHIIKLQGNRLGLIDGEHALHDGVENYDICYFTQRVFSVLKNPSLAQGIYSRLINNGYEVDKLRTVLSARVIGGFLDESLNSKPNYKFANNFREWIIKI